MYSARPLGINTRQNDRDVDDGFLQESINLQERDGVFKIIPNRLLTDINTSLYGNIILHKVGDEDQINVLGFSRSSYGFLAEDLGAYLGGGEDTLNGDLTWFGTIIDGLYMPKSPVIIAVKRTAGMSWTILNGLIYFMGNGTTAEERYYLRVQYNDSDSSYETKDMYAWKSLIPYYPSQETIKLNIPKQTYNVCTQCGFVLTRFTLVLKTGEEVLHSPMYFNYLYGVNVSSIALNSENAIDNIHTVINMNLEFLDNELFADEISAINVYCSVPYYKDKLPVNASAIYLPSPNFAYFNLVTKDMLRGEIQKSMEQPFYLVKTIEKPTTDQLVLSVGGMDHNAVFKDSSSNTIETSNVDIFTIAAGQPMPVDNFSYHKKYGKITSSNGRLVIYDPVTVISDGSTRSLCLETGNSYSSVILDTEDGRVNELSSLIDKLMPIDTYGGGSSENFVYTRGLLSYPDLTASTIGVAGDAVNLYYLKSRKNKSHNMSCVFDFYQTGLGATTTFLEVSANVVLTTKYQENFLYSLLDLTPVAISGFVRNDKYSSQNAVQFSAIGEFSVWPVINNYRIGDGRVLKVGANNVDQKSANLLSMLVVGTTDGVWSINTDPTGNNFVSSVTRRSFTPYISSEVLQIGNAIFFIGDKGLMVMVGGNEPENLTYNYFPGQGDGNPPDNEDIIPNYTVLTEDYFNGSNLYVLDDVVNYLKDCKLSFDNRRKTIWCSNPNEAFSLLYDIENRKWGMSTSVFSEVIDLFGSITVNIGNVQSWYLVMDNNALQPYLMILSGEDMEKQVFFHLLTRPIKFNGKNDITDKYKKIERMFTRCEIYRDVTETGYFRFGLWGKQDLNKLKESIPLAAIADGQSISFPGNVRQDIPVGSRKGKYKSVSLLIGGLALPDSSINKFDFEVGIVDNSLMR